MIRTHNPKLFRPCLDVEKTLNSFLHFHFLHIFILIPKKLRKQNTTEKLQHQTIEPNESEKINSFRNPWIRRRIRTSFGNAEPEFENDPTEIAPETRFVRAVYGDHARVALLLPALDEDHVVVRYSHAVRRQIPIKWTEYSDVEGMWVRGLGGNIPVRMRVRIRNLPSSSSSTSSFGALAQYQEFPIVGWERS